MIEDEVKEVRRHRQAIYGDFQHGHTQLGRIWAAMLSNHLQVHLEDLPPDIVLAMLAGLKMSRISIVNGRAHHDNFVDAQAYLQMCEESWNMANKL